MVLEHLLVHQPWSVIFLVTYTKRMWQDELCIGAQSLAAGGRGGCHKAARDGSLRDTRKSTAAKTKSKDDDAGKTKTIGAGGAIVTNKAGTPFALPLLLKHPLQERGQQTKPQKKKSRSKGQVVASAITTTTTITITHRNSRVVPDQTSVHTRQKKRAPPPGGKSDRKQKAFRTPAPHTARQD